METCLLPLSLLHTVASMIFLKCGYELNKKEIKEGKELIDMGNSVVIVVVRERRVGRDGRRYREIKVNGKNTIKILKM